ncbi:hypothetical protein, partial [Nocardia brasiliensis]|uniref:hypothetical protein n=1 Tax=Nocardia brasiliensis TaxID=37326 RepID=UPI0024539D05
IHRSSRGGGPRRLPGPPPAGGGGGGAAADDVHAYGATYPLARIRAGVLACAGDDPAGQRAIWHRLAAGLADSLARMGLSSPSADRR